MCPFFLVDLSFTCFFMIEELRAFDLVEGNVPECDKTRPALRGMDKRTVADPTVSVQERIKSRLDELLRGDYEWKGLGTCESCLKEVFDYGSVYSILGSTEVQMETALIFVH